MLHYLVFKVQFRICYSYSQNSVWVLFFLGSPGKAIGFFGEKEEQGGDFTNSRIADLFFSRLCSDVVEMRRIELLTPCLQGRCSPSWATPPNLTWYFGRNNLPYTRTAFAVSFLSELKLLILYISRVKFDSVWFFFAIAVCFVHTIEQKNLNEQIWWA